MAIKTQYGNEVKILACAKIDGAVAFGSPVQVERVYDGVRRVYQLCDLCAPGGLPEIAAAAEVVASDGLLWCRECGELHTPPTCT